jgi:hypothetical protein
MTYVRQLSHNLPDSCLIQSLHHTSVFEEEERQGAKTQLGLDKQLPILLPRILKLDDMRVRLDRQVSQDIDFFEVTQPGRQLCRCNIV